MPFHTNSYKTALNDALLANRTHSPKRYTYQNLAKACGVQKTYLSKAFREETTHLSRDQAYLGCDFLAFTPAERDYVLLLHEHERSTVAKRRAEILVKIRAVQSQQSRTEQHLSTAKASMPETPDMASYFLDPLAQLAHMFLTVERYRKDTKKLQRDLRLDEEELARVLELLRRLGVIGVDGGEIKVLSDNLHLPSSSSTYKPYRMLLRQQTLSKMQATPAGRDYYFSVIFSSSEATRMEIQKKFLVFLKEVEKSVQPGPFDEVFQMNFDLLKWS